MTFQGSPIEHTFTSVPGTNVVSVTAVDAQGCTQTANATIVVHPEADDPFAATLDEVVCFDPGTATLQAMPGFASYQWSDDSGDLTGETNDNLTAGEGSYFVSVEDANGCPRTSGPITVQVLPDLSPTIIGPSVVCGTGQATFQIAGFYTDYKWFQDGILVATSPTLTVSGAPGTLHNIEVVVVGADDCPHTSNLHPVEWVQDVNFFLTSPNLPPCAGDNVLIEVNPVDPSVNYSWNTGATGPNITVQNAGIYTATGVNANGCFHSASFEVLPTPDLCAVPTGCYENCGPDTLCAPEGYASYQWFPQPECHCGAPPILAWRSTPLGYTTSWPPTAMGAAPCRGTWSSPCSIANATLSLSMPFQMIAVSSSDLKTTAPQISLTCMYSPTNRVPLATPRFSTTPGPRPPQRIWKSALEVRPKAPFPMPFPSVQMPNPLERCNSISVGSPKMRTLAGAALSMTAERDTTQCEPLTCNNWLYQVYGADNKVGYFDPNNTAGGFTVLPFNYDDGVVDVDDQVNATGYRVLDDYAYGIARDAQDSVILVRIGNNGCMEDLGTISNHPNNLNFQVQDFSSDGFLDIQPNQGDFSTNNPSAALVNAVSGELLHVRQSATPWVNIIDVDTRMVVHTYGLTGPATTSTTWDFARSTDGLFYGVDKDAEQLVSIDPMTGSTAFIGTPNMVVGNNAGSPTLRLSRLGRSLF